jgi:hypothetical protein
VQQTPVHVAYPAADNPHLLIALGACRFTAGPGESAEWLSGTYYDPTERRPLRILEEEAGATITEAEPSFERIRAAFGGVPRYELRFGKQKPFSLRIETGASDFELDLGGIPLKRLVVRQGAGKLELDFAHPNPQRMELLDLSSGAAGIELENLANANFSKMRLSGGAAGYELDFGGSLSQDAEVSIDTGISGIELSVPGATATSVSAETTLGRVEVGDGFTKREGAFLNQAALSGEGPFLRISVGLSLGSLQLRTR